MNIMLLMMNYLKDRVLYLESNSRSMIRCCNRSAEITMICR